MSLLKVRGVQSDEAVLPRHDLLRLNITMSDNSLIVPTLLPTGSLHFAAVKVDSVVQDVLNALTGLKEVQEDILGDWQYDRWAIQKIRKETPGRHWDEHEIERLSDGEPFHCLHIVLAPSSNLIQAFYPPLHLFILC